MSEFRAKLHEKGFKENMSQFADSMDEMDSSKGITRFQTRKIVRNLYNISERAEQSIKEYVSLGKDDKVEELYSGTLSVYKSTIPILPDSAAREATLNIQRFERRVIGYVQSNSLKQSYGDLKSSFKVKKRTDNE